MTTEPVTPPAEIRLWQEAEASLAFHQKVGRDNSPIDVLNRIFRELMQPQVKVVPTLDRGSCFIREESISCLEMAQLIRKHARAKPKRADGALVVVEFLSQRYLIDGTNRVNKWLAAQDAALRRVLVVRIKS